MMNKKMKKTLILAAALTTVFAFMGCGQTGKDAAPKETVQENNSTEAAPEDAADASAEDTAKDTADASKGDGFFQTMDTTDLEGSKMDVSAFKDNKLTLVNTWNIGCTPCVQELPELGKISRDYEGKGVAVMGLYYAKPEYLEQDRAAIEELLTKAEADYSQITLTEEMDNSETMQQLQAFPTTYIVDSEGNILNTYEGSRDYDGWKKVIEDELAKVEANA